MIEYDDKDLVQRCLKGEGKAFEFIVEKYQKPLFNLVYRMTHSLDDAEDITQVVFIKAYENLKNYDNKFKFYSWIYRITLNEALNFVNRKKRIDVLPDELESYEDTPEQLYRKSEMDKNIQDALMRLEPKYRMLIILNHFQNYSYSEISKITEVEEKKVKSRLFTARQLLKDILIKNGIFEHE